MNEPPRAPEDPVADETSAFTRRLVQLYPWHLWGFAGLNGALTLANIVTGPPWWAFWPLLVTGLLFGIHYLFFKTATTDEDWVEQRIDELNVKSYDQGHIEDIRERATRHQRRKKP